MAREFKIPILDTSVLPSVHAEAIKRKYDDMVRKIKEGKSPRELFLEERMARVKTRKGGNTNG